jgi:hypothetical protein
MVGDGDAVRVAGEVMQDVLCSAERRLGVDDPLVGVELAQELAEAPGAGQFLKRTVKLELALKQELLEFRGELAAKDAAENTYG